MGKAETIFNVFHAVLWAVSFIFLMQMWAIINIMGITTITVSLEESGITEGVLEKIPLVVYSVYTAFGFTGIFLVGSIAIYLGCNWVFGTGIQQIIKYFESKENPRERVRGKVVG